MSRDFRQHRFASLTADPGGLADGDMWFRSDIDAMRVRINGATYSLVPDVGAITDYWYTPGWDNGSNAQTPIVSRMYATPVIVPRTGTITGLAMTIGVAFTTAGNMRMGIYGSITNGGAPGALLLDCGTVAATAGTKTFTGLTQAVSPGLYWLVSVFQGGSAGSPTHRTAVGSNPYVGQSGASPDITTSSLNGYYKDSVTGALPNPFGTIAGVVQSTKIMLKYA